MGKKLVCRKSFLSQFLEVRAEMQELDWALASGSSELLCPLQPLSSSHPLSHLMHSFISRCFVQCPHTGRAFTPEESLWASEGK